jgi:protoheme ferro-lyase
MNREKINMLSDTNPGFVEMVTTLHGCAANRRACHDALGVLRKHGLDVTALGKVHDAYTTQIKGLSDALEDLYGLTWHDWTAAYNECGLEA